MSSKPSGFGDFPRTKEHHHLRCRCRYADSNHRSTDPAVEPIFDTQRRVNGEDTGAGDRDRKTDADESEDVLPSLIRPDRHPELPIPDAPLHYENTD